MWLFVYYEMTRRKLVGGSCAGAMKETQEMIDFAAMERHWGYSNWLCEHSHGTTCENRC